MTDQPRHPDQFDYDEQDAAGDQDESYIAPDAPMAVQSRGTTAKEQREGETFAERDRHTTPEVWERPLEESAAVHQLVQPGDDDVAEIDLEAQLLARELDLQEGVDLANEDAAVHERPE